jgi:hypothetical protein
MRISKSGYIAGVQCLKRLAVHKPEMQRRTEGSDEGIIKHERQVGLLSRQLFAGGVKVQGPMAGSNRRSAPRRN